MRRILVVAGLVGSSAFGAINATGSVGAIDAGVEPFGDGNLLVSSDETLFEVDLDGEVLQSFSTEYPGGYPATESARDIAVGGDGVARVFNGTFSPYLSSFDPADNTWVHRTHPDWKTVNNGTYGGIDIIGNRVFVTSNLTVEGVVVFEVGSDQSELFAEGTRAIDLTVGLDGLLYVLSPSGSPGGRTVDVYDPHTLSLVRTISLSDIFGHTEHRSVAVDAAGDLFIADWDGEIHHVSASGELISTIAPPCDWIGREIHCEFSDIDVSRDGQIAVGSRFGEVVVTDVGFSTISKFSLGSRGVFVEFVEGPSVLEVNIDVKPRKSVNKIDPSQRGWLAVAIHSAEGFDASTVDPATIVFGPDGASPGWKPRLVDVDRDGDVDMKLLFRIRDIGVACGDTELTLEATTFDGVEISGSDGIITVRCRS